MAKEILLYGGFYTFSAEDFINKMEEAKSEDVTLRILSNGGDPESSFGMIGKWKEHLKGKKTKTDAYARSTAAYFLCYSEDNECLDVSKFMFHRAAYPQSLENNLEWFTEERKKELNDVNNPLRSALEAKVNVPTFERITGVTMDQLFSLDGRIDVTLDASQAKKVGLINKIIKITPEIRAEVNSNMSKIAALGFDEDVIIEAKQIQETTIKKMDLNKLKAEHPHVYAEAVKDGILQGVKQEKERISAFLVFADVDIKAVKEGIEGVEPLSTTKMAEFVRKSASAEFLKDTKEGSIPPVTTEAQAVEAQKTEKEKQVSTFEAEVKANLNLN
jgi:ATP-dependent protease ClpP protease subunit